MDNLLHFDSLRGWKAFYLSIFLKYGLSTSKSEDETVYKKHPIIFDKGFLNWKLLKTFSLSFKEVSWKLTEMMKIESESLIKIEIN